VAVPSTQVLAAWVKESLTDEAWVPLSEALMEAVSSRWTGKSHEEVADFVEEKLPFVAEHLRDEAACAAADGAICPFEIDPEELEYVRRIELAADHLLQKLRRICPFDFEEVCARLLSELGADSKVTARSGDGGIDFIAVGVDILPAAINSPMQCRAAVIGQAKRYTNRLIAERALREFVGASVLQRNNLRVQQRISPLTPVLLAFWSTANFEPNCKEFARRSGVWLMDGHTISSYLGKLGLTEWVMSLPDEVSIAPIPSTTTVQEIDGPGG